MRYAFVASILLITAAGARADHRPALTWEGDVDGTAVLVIQAGRVDVDSRSSGSVTRNDFRFMTPLQSYEQDITVENRQGGGRVRIIQQPSETNHYTAMVEIQTRGQGPRPISLDFYWDDRRARTDDRGSGSRGRSEERFSDSSSPAPAQGGSLRWAGDVDGEVLVTMRGRQVLNTAVRGRNVEGQKIDSQSSLPRFPVTVTLTDVQGRGQVELIEQPTNENQFMAKIRIVDPQPGSAPYSFNLTWDNAGVWNESKSWNDPGGRRAEGSRSRTIDRPGYSSQTGGLHWSGQVDGQVRLTIRDRQASVQRLSGQSVLGEQANFRGGLPAGNIDADVRKLRGRGEVSLVERPSAANDYSLVIDISDREPGADLYELEVSWR